MRKLVLVVGLVLMASGVQAAMLNVINGILHGASGVDVGGALYDVEFLDGSCVEVFSGCDELTDITFLGDEAVTAAQALLDQVFIGQFDNDPELTRGCTSTDTCRVQIPRWINEDGSAPVAIAINWRAGAGAIGFSDGVLDNSSWSGNGTTSTSTLAKFTSIPEPSTALLVGLGLAGMAARRRPRR